MKRHAPAAPLLAALALSVLAHAFTLSGGWLQLPQQQADPAPLQASLRALAPAPPPAPTPVHAKVTPKPRAAAVVAAAPMTRSTDSPATPAWSMPDSAAPDPSPTAAEVAAAEPVTPPHEPVVIASAAPSTYIPEVAVVRTLPRRGRIVYNLDYYVGGNPFNVGRTVQTWEATGNTYKLASASTTVGLARLTRFGPRVYESSGQVTARGLSPQTFTSRVVVSDKSDDSTAHFDWEKQIIAFGASANQKRAALPQGSQDLLSFMFQLSLSPPARGRLQIPVTNGSRLDTYELDVFDEETIETPLGAIRALPVKQVRTPGRESIEVWLAADYRYLPVRIRFIGRDGTPGGEQIIADIRIGDE